MRNDRLNTDFFIINAMRNMVPGVCAFMFTLLALPVNAAITLPKEPLTTGARVAPNLLFILDDSGSMSWNYMPDSVPAISGNDFASKAYTRNTVYYDPSIDYQPWTLPDGSLMTAGVDYSRAFSDTDFVAYRGSGAGAITTNSATVNLSANTQEFFVPKDISNNSDAYISVAANYYRYQILRDGRIIRSAYGARTGSSPRYNQGLANSGCTTSIFNGWRECEQTTPTGRTEAEEKRNYAIWYSYHRTRMKAAKAGVSAVFNELSGDIRVGFRTIWQRNGASSAANSPKFAAPIPVAYNDGLFADLPAASGRVAIDNKTKWYERLYEAKGSGGTPLHGALQKAGEYFSSDSSSGPYGPAVRVNQLECRQNFTILTTDGYWNDSSNYSSRTGNADGTAGVEITGPNGQSYTYRPVDPYRDSYVASDLNFDATLADVAMYYWKNDLRPDLDNLVPTSSGNPAFWQHMVTFGIAIGMSGTVDQKSVGEVLQNGRATVRGVAGWPKPVSNQNTTIDDLFHAAVNGRGEFVSAGNPEMFTSGLKSALASITERTGSFANVGANSTSLDAGTQLFQASYVSGTWTGQVVAYPVVNGKVATSVAWKAADGIPAQNRKVFTRSGSGGVVFPDGLANSQLQALTRTGITNYPVTGAENASYIAGSRSLETQNGGGLRNRNSLMGDVVSSSPAYVKDTETLFVGANDGMLHAIDSSNGKELFTFIPGGIDWSDLGTLSRPDYSHRYFVDGPIVVSSRTQTPGKNILVGALGKGGKGIYSLDVSRPSTFGVNDVKWEVRDANGSMGLVQSKPIIAKLNNGVDAVIVANGINSTNGRAVLLIFDLETGALIREIDTGVGAAVNDGEDSNGLSSPIGWDVDGSGTVDYVYSGDMRGNLWKFDLRAATTSTWGVSRDAPLFQATNSSGQSQPIVGGITIAMHPRTFKTWVFFGTGRLLTEGDMTSDSQQSLYGIVDDGTVLSRSGANANLTARKVIVKGTSSGFPVRSFEAKSALPIQSKGWYLDLELLDRPSSREKVGERIVSDPQLYGDVLIVSSVIPTANACQADGRGYLNALDAFTGTSTGPSLFDLNANGKFDDEVLESGRDKLPIGSVDLGVGMPTLAELLRGIAVLGGSSGNIANVGIREARNVGRVSWREILDN